MQHTDQEISAFSRAGLNLIAQGLSIFDSDLRLVLANQPFRDMFNLPPAMVTPGARFADTIDYLARKGDYGPIDDIEAFVKAREEQARTFEPHYVERTRANGRTISVEGAPLPQGGWVAVYTDITRTKQSESLLRARSAELSDQVLAHTEALSARNRELASTNLALAETKRQLTETEARIRLTTEMLPAHIAHVDKNGIYTYSNRRLSAVMPGRPSQIVGKPIADTLGDMAFARIKPYLDNAYGGESAVFEMTDEESSRRIRVAFTPDPAGGVYILSMDVTAETQARVALQQAHRRQVAAQLTSGLAHDFSNLLTIVLGLQSQLSRLDLPQGAQDLVEATTRTARRGGRLLNRIADMTGSRTARPEPTDITALLEELKLLTRSSLPETIGFSVVSTLPQQRLMIDADMLQDALLNLVLNARDACDGRGQITVSAHEVAGTWIEISVVDTGTGFSPKALEQALDPFFTTKGDEGSGLGLPMVYDMVKLAGGDLRLENTAGGAAVRLRLPYRKAPERADGLVLLVEDSDSLREQIRGMLLKLGFTVVEASSVDEALALVGNIPELSLILSDIHLRGDAKGTDLLEHLGAGAPPLLFMTSLPPTDPDFQKAAKQTPVLRKPFSLRDLTALLPERTAS